MRKKILILASLILALTFIFISIYTTIDTKKKKFKTYNIPISKEELLSANSKRQSCNDLVACSDCDVIFQSNIEMYYKKDNAIYCKTRTTSKDLLVTKDINSFELFSYSSTTNREHATYGRDSTNVYLYGKAIKDADVDTFKPLAVNGYAIDSSNVYYFGNSFPNADPKTFVLTMSYPITAYDNTAIYVLGNRIPLITKERTLLIEKPITAQSRIYEKTDTQVRTYYNVEEYRKSHVQRTLSEVDPKSFSIISNRYTRDNTHVYLDGIIIKDANAKTFEVLGNGYARDNTNVYLHSQKVKSANPATFSVIGGAYATDARHVFWMGYIIPEIKSSNYELRNSTYVLDDAHTYVCIPHMCECKCDDTQKGCHLLENANTSNFNIILHKVYNNESYDTVLSYATNGAVVWKNGHEYATYERDYRLSDEYDADTKTKIVVHKNSTFAKKLVRIPNGNYFLYNSAVWYVYNLGKHPIAEESVRGSIRDISEYFVLKYVSGYEKNSDIELYRCDYLRIGSSIFCESYLLKGADPATFNILGNTQCMYAKDASHVFYFWQEMTDADAQTFELDQTRKGWATDFWYSYQGYFERGYKTDF